MDIALRAAGIYRRMELRPGEDWNIIELSALQLMLVHCYSDCISGKTSITQDKERIVQAADFLIKEVRQRGTRTMVLETICRLSP
jgi:hypothetical protein